MKQIDSLDIAVVVKQSGLPTSTLRYYEELGLIKPIGRQGLRRVYAPSVVQRLGLISLGRQVGFSLQDIGLMFDEGGEKIDRDKLRLKADELDENIKKLRVMRDGLRHAAACSSDSHLQCPRFLRILRLSNKYQTRKRLRD
jgi:DNA-binding transcriptional MerR regulator